MFFQHWAVFKHVPEVFILVPALLGLKGNLEMTLASRLSTQVREINLRLVYCTIIKVLCFICICITYFVHFFFIYFFLNLRSDEYEVFGQF